MCLCGRAGVCVCGGGGGGRWGGGGDVELGVTWKQYPGRPPGGVGTTLVHLI